MERLSEEECLERGGHFWRYWQGNDQVNLNFEKLPFSTLLGFIGPEPKYRGCPICGRTEHLIPEQWVEGAVNGVKQTYEKAKDILEEIGETIQC